MPTYEYGCDLCEKTQDVYHSIKDKPEVLCPICGGTCRKLVTGFYLGGTSSPSTIEMKRDLADNLGIEQVNMLNGSFKNFYHGVKKDANRVKEEMARNQESKKKEPVKPLSLKESEKRVAIIKENRAKKEYNKRKVTI